MSRQATIRNLRSRGMTVINTLKVCLMIIGFAWILYQFKFSHQKKKTYEEKSSKVSLDTPEFCKQNLPHSNKTHRREFINRSQSTEGDNKNGVEELRAVENEQLEYTSRAAREDSLKGDDASSEVVAERGNRLAAGAADQDSSAHDLPREKASKPLRISEKNNSDIVPKGNQTLVSALNKTSSRAQNSTTTTTTTNTMISRPEDQNLASTL